MKKVLAAILILAAIGASVLVIAGRTDNKTTENQSVQTPVGGRQSDNLPNTIIMTANGFEPETLTIKRGETVTFKNTDSEEHWPASDPHPVHTDYSALDPRRPIAAGESWTFTFNEAGVYNMHDHLFPVFKTTLTVE